MSFNFFKVWTSHYQIAAMDNLKCALRFDEVSTKKIEYAAAYGHRQTVRVL